MDPNCDFDSYFSSLLTPVEIPADEFDNDKLPSINSMGISSAATNLFFMSRQSLFDQDNATPSNENECIQESLTDEDNSLSPLNHFQNGLPMPTPMYPYPIIQSNIPIIDSPQQVIASPQQMQEMQQVDQADQVDQAEVVKESPKKRKANVTKKQNSAKRAKMSKATTGTASERKRSNYCFDIHRVSCPYERTERYYCNVSLQGKLQETVELVKGKRGKYAYTFFDQRKQKQERRYWPSQSCGPVVEDDCECERCLGAPKRIVPKVVPKKIRLIVRDKRTTRSTKDTNDTRETKDTKDDLKEENFSSPLQVYQRPSDLPVLPQISSIFQHNQQRLKDSIPSFDHFHTLPPPAFYNNEEGPNVIFLEDVVLDM